MKPSYLFVSLPLFLNLVAVLIYRGTYRRAAALVLPFICGVWLFDGYSASQDGNLTGLITILIGLPLMVVLLLIGIANAIAGTRPETSKPAAPMSFWDPNVLRALILGAIFGSIVVGLLFGGTAGMLVRFVFPTLGLGDGNAIASLSIGNEAWFLGALFGVAGGAVYSWILDMLSRR